ncbi:MAG: hypothetical protein V4642_09080 [Bacteroidota bacterium]
MDFSFKIQTKFHAELSRSTKFTTGLLKRITLLKNSDNPGFRLIFNRVFKITKPVGKFRTSTGSV